MMRHVKRLLAIAATGIFMLAPSIPDVSAASQGGGRSAGASGGMNAGSRGGGGMGNVSRGGGGGGGMGMVSRGGGGGRNFGGDGGRRYGGDGGRRFDGGGRGNVVYVSTLRDRGGRDRDDRRYRRSRNYGGYGVGYGGGGSYYDGGYGGSSSGLIYASYRDDDDTRCARTYRMRYTSCETRRSRRVANCE